MENPLNHDEIEECVKHALRFTANKFPASQRHDEQAYNITCLLGLEGHLDPKHTLDANSEIAKIIKGFDASVPGPSLIKKIRDALVEFKFVKVK